jgi:putative methionine-R-sulfoxide reductase with GAF domain
MSIADIVPPHKQRYKKASFEGLLGFAFATGRTQNIPNVKFERRYFPAVVETKSELVVPIRSGYSVIGLINSESEEIAAFDRAMCDEIEAIAGAFGELLPIYGWSTINPPELPIIELTPA